MNISTPATRLAYRCSLENQIDALLGSYSGADDVLFRLLRDRLPTDCRETLDALKACADVLNGTDIDEGAPQLAAMHMRDEAGKLATELEE